MLLVYNAESKIMNVLGLLHGCHRTGSSSRLFQCVYVFKWPFPRPLFLKQSQHIQIFRVHCVHLCVSRKIWGPGCPMAKFPISLFFCIGTWDAVFFSLFGRGQSLGCLVSMAALFILFVFSRKKNIEFECDSHQSSFPYSTALLFPAILVAVAGTRTCRAML